MGLAAAIPAIVGALGTIFQGVSAYKQGKKLDKSIDEDRERIHSLDDANRTLGEGSLFETQPTTGLGKMGLGGPGTGRPFMTNNVFSPRNDFTKNQGKLNPLSYGFGG